MAKNMHNASYRKLDVDAYDPEQFQDQDDNNVDTPGLGIDEKQVNQLLQSGRFDDALRMALRNPPMRTKNQALKDKATAAVIRVLTSFKQADMTATVANLSGDELDLLMKYVYKGMENHADGATCQSLLAWHAQVVERAGYGAIVRVFTDRRRL